jgi:hypothetical protein
MTTVYRYRLRCLTENAYVTRLGDSTLPAPTTCPNDTSHIIDPDLTAIVQTISENSTFIMDGTPGFYQTTTVPLVIPGSTGATGYVTTITTSFVFDVALWTTKIIPHTEMIGDSLSVIVAPNEPVSMLTIDGNTGDTVLNLMPDTFASMAILKGNNLSIIDPTNTITQDLGMVTAYDPYAFTITVQNPLTTNFIAGSVILLNVYMMKDYIFSAAQIQHTFGGKSVNTKKIPANKIVEFLYTNNNGLPKTVYFDIEYNHT